MSYQYTGTNIRTHLVRLSVRSDPSCPRGMKKICLNNAFIASCINLNIYIRWNRLL